MPSLNRHLRAARDFLVKHRENYDVAYAAFTWPQLPLFNFATEWFDGLAEEDPDGLALWVIEAETETRLTFRELADRSVAVAQYLHHLGLRRGDSLLVVLGNVVPLWEVMLGAIRMGAVVIPATPQLSPADLADRVSRGGAKMLVADHRDAAKFEAIELPLGRLLVGGTEVPEGWLSYHRVEDFLHADRHLPGISKGDDPVLLYFTSGTTALPKLVEHSQTSYPVGHLSTLYWMGLRPGDVHLNLSSPGWGKHAWSNFFTPWLAGATVLVLNSPRFDPAELLEVLVRCRVTTFCAPPTAWRMLVQADLASVQTTLRECLSAGEPLNAEVIQQVRSAWGLTVRDGYGQTETTAQVGNPPGARVKDGSMGRPLPGYDVLLVDPGSGEPSNTDGELCLRLEPRPVALMKGYKSTADTADEALNADSFSGGIYHTGDLVSRDEDGYLTYVGRVDDVFKASDYRISPFELESVLIEHPAVAEAAVVPAPDEVRLAVPKAYVILAAGHQPDADTARSILGHAREHLAPYQRIRRLEFGELPKTTSGKIRRVELRDAEDQRPERSPAEFWDSDFDWPPTS
nr:AMP-binding protein [uncultured Friedmanniella sp.]